MKSWISYLVAICIGVSLSAIYSSNAFAFSVTGSKQCSNPVYFRWGGSIAYIHQTGTTQAIKDWNAAQSKRDFVGSQSASGVIDSYTQSDRKNGYTLWNDGLDSCIDYWVSKLNNTYTNSYEESRNTGGHELGHVLGLADNNYSNTLMYYTRNLAIQTPQTDDINGINYIYQ
jgi:hypothetical protein